MSTSRKISPRLLYTLLACTLAAAALWLGPPRSSKARPSVTRASFEKIQVGMPRADLDAVLGTPEIRVTELGKVDGPEHYTTNDSQSEAERRANGFRDYRREQWTSATIAIVVITDGGGKVVCRYSGSGDGADWAATLQAWLPAWGR